MPIKPENAKLYPKNWPEIVISIGERSGWKCEGSPKYPDCRAEHGAPHPVTASIVVLTVAHLNHNPADCAEDNLRHWCQRCHNTYDLPMRRRNAAETIRGRKAIGDLFAPPPIPGADG